MRISLQKSYVTFEKLECIVFVLFVVFFLVLFRFRFSIFNILVFCAARGFSYRSISRQRISTALSSQTFWIVCHRFGVQSIIYCIDTFVSLSLSLSLCVFWWTEQIDWIELLPIHTLSISVTCVRFSFVYLLVIQTQALIKSIMYAWCFVWPVYRRVALPAFWHFK